MNDYLQKHHDSLYRGRFAPSPSGLLHFGSLVTALASYLDAKAHDGIWLVRIEDIDPPRELVGASDSILRTLEAYELYWDETVLYQSNQSQYYLQLLDTLQKNKQSYYCQCTRAQIKAMGGIYQGLCREKKVPKENAAIRLINQAQIDHFHDLIQGDVVCDKQLASEDFTIHRKDGLFAYQLAVVADDIAQNITHVIRGCDLLEPTARQLSFYETLKKPAPQYGHIPLAVTEQGYKLSKQNKAPAIDTKSPQASLIEALSFLGQNPDTQLKQASVAEIIHWGIQNWQRCLIPKQQEITITY